MLATDPCNALGTDALRLRAAAQLFKRALLVERHRPGGTQVDAVTHALSARGIGDGNWISDRTWTSWCRGVGVAQHASLGRLEAVVREAIRWKRPCDGAQLHWPEGFFHDLVRGGLLRAVSGALRDVDLAERSIAYQPKSAWHLHFDALEAMAYDGERTSAGRRSVKFVAAMSVLSWIDRLWGQRRGLIYRHLSKNGRPTCGGNESRSGPMERPEPRGSECGARPNWGVVRAGSDSAAEHACITMLALMSDAELLHGDRLVAWSFDLATATLATQALLWCDRHYAFNSSPVSSTLVAWLGLVQVLFADSEKDIDDRTVRAAVEHAGVAWSAEVQRLFMDARSSYWTEMAGLGLAPAEIQRVREYAEAVPLWRTIG